ncbi:glutathione S-transferase family protein [Massilia horti]|uniref:Glutathione S-transferase family protein n=1 Tax=Massilia horti TaxID=2562153 RepID=A0A4Y9T380_9BURK|nr:glutathione S-transferase family protein [Massilia horti]
MKLFGNRESGHAYKVRLMLNLAGLAHEFEEVDVFAPRETRSEEFRSLAKYGEVPLLLHGGQAYVQSNAILLHLAAHSGALGGDDTATTERVREWLFWEANRIGFSLANLRYSLRWSSAEPAVQGMLRRRFDADIAYLDGELSDGRAFILGASPTVADLSLCGYLFWPDQAQVELPGHVQAWLGRIAALPGWRHPYDFY